MQADNGIFKGLVVVELASVLAGPSVGQFFAELGARVIKIENAKTHGDVTRKWKLAVEAKETTVSAYFSAANWGKESVCVDLTDAEVRKAVYAIMGQADIVLASFKPGDAEKLGMDFNTLSTLKPSLIYGSITGYGSEEPRAGYDAVLQAEAGFMYLNAEKGGKPMKMPVALMDLLAAHQLKEGLLAALYLREKTGNGQLVEVSLLRAAISSLANQATNFLVAGVVPVPMGSEHPNIVPYGTIFKTSDGKELVLAIGDDRQFAALCAILGNPALAEKEEFKTNAARVVHRKELTQHLTALVAVHPRDELLQKLILRHVPAGAVNNVQEALAQPLALPQLLQNEAGQAKGIRQVAFQLNRQACLSLRQPPELGADTQHILNETGSTTQLEAAQWLSQGKVVGAPK